MSNGESSKAGDATRATSLALVEAFRDLLAEHLTELELLLITQAVSRGEVLMRQGDAADALYLVASGRFAVNVDGRRIAEVGSGSPIGEIGFFADGIRTAPSRRCATQSCSNCLRQSSRPSPSGIRSS